MVRYCGHEVVAIVGSGLEAIQSYARHKPDLVLMDHRMPKLNGVTASRHIIAKNPQARIILVSAWSPLDGADESGAICFLPKPVELARLNATLLTLSQSIPPPAAEETTAPFNFEPAPIEPVFEPLPFVPIPPEIISPIETFPIDIFPIEAPASQNGFEQTETGTNGGVVAQTKPRKARVKRAKRNGTS